MHAPDPQARPPCALVQLRRTADAGRARRPRDAMRLFFAFFLACVEGAARTASGERPTHPSLEVASFNRLPKRLPASRALFAHAHLPDCSPLQAAAVSCCSWQLGQLL